MGSLPDHPWFSTDDDSLVILSFPAHPEDRDVLGLIDALERWYDDDVDTERIWLVDLSSVETAPSHQRAMLAEYEIRNADRTSARVIASAFIAPTVILRAIVTATYWLRPPVYPYRVFADYEQGKQWVLSQEAQYRKIAAS